MSFAPFLASFAIPAVSPILGDLFDDFLGGTAFAPWTDMLGGAVTGAAVAAITGEDPLAGALGGGAGVGLSGWLTGQMQMNPMLRDTFSGTIAGGAYGLATGNALEGLAGGAAGGLLTNYLAGNQSAQMTAAAPQAPSPTTVAPSLTGQGNAVLPGMTATGAGQAGVGAAGSAGAGNAILSQMGAQAPGPASTGLLGGNMGQLALGMALSGGAQGWLQGQQLKDIEEIRQRNLLEQLERQADIERRQWLAKNAAFGEGGLNFQRTG